MAEAQTLFPAICNAPNALNFGLSFRKTDLVYVISKSFPTF